MKVLVLATTFPRWPDDSEPPFILKFSESIRKLGHDVFVLVPHAPGARYHEDWEGVRIYRFPYFFPRRWQRLCYEGGIVPKLKTSFLAWLNLPPFLICQGWAIGRLICKEDVELVHAHWLLPQGFFAVLWSYWFKIPVVSTIHGSDIFVFGKGIMGWVTRFVVHKSSAVTVNSRRAKEKLPKKVQDRVCLVPMGVDFDLFHPGDREEAKKLLGLRGPLILGVGRFSRQKGFIYLVQSLPFVKEKIPNVRLMLIGEGPERRDLMKMVRELELESSVIFKGSLPQDQVADYYRASDVVVLPSIRTKLGEEEGFGLVLAEAMASGVPVIGTTTGGIPSIIEDGVSGLLVPDRDDRTLAEAILKILLQPDLRESLIQGGLSAVREKCDWGKIAQEFDHIYRLAVR